MIDNRSSHPTNQQSIRCPSFSYVTRKKVPFVFALAVNQSMLSKKKRKKEICVSVLLFFPLRHFDIDVGKTTGSGSSEDAHPLLSLHIRTICMGAFRRVILSMQNRCHAVSACYTSVEAANLPPHMYS